MKLQQVWSELLFAAIKNRSRVGFTAVWPQPQSWGP